MQRRRNVPTQSVPAATLAALCNSRSRWRRQTPLRGSRLYIASSLYPQQPPIISHYDCSWKQPLVMPNGIRLTFAEGCQITTAAAPVVIAMEASNTVKYAIFEKTVLRNWPTRTGYHRLLRRSQGGA
jgi:hypothetical protein